MTINDPIEIIYMALPSSLFLGMSLSDHRSSNKCNIVQDLLSSIYRDMDIVLPSSSVAIIVYSNI